METIGSDVAIFRNSILTLRVTLYKNAERSFYRKKSNYITNSHLGDCSRLTPVVRGEHHHQPAFMGNCLTISHTCLPCPPRRLVSPCLCSMSPYDWTNGGSVGVFLEVVSMVLVTWDLVLF